MSIDGHIADGNRSPARIGSPADRKHLDLRLCGADAVLFGATTLRAIGHGVTILDPKLLDARTRDGLPGQPIQIVASRTGELDVGLRFFDEPTVRWLITTGVGSPKWAERTEFADILVGDGGGEVDWHSCMAELASRGVRRLCLVGGGDLVAAVVGENLVDELWLTVCPVIIGGSGAPTPVDGPDRPLGTMPPVTLVSCEHLGEEVFLHYRRA